MLSRSTPAKPLLRQLLFILDDADVIRFCKRVHNAPVSKSTKFLLLIQSKDPFTELDISDTHVNQLYACANSTPNLVRLRCWIPAGRGWTPACQESNQSLNQLQDDYCRPSAPQGNQCLISHFLASLGAQED